MSLENKTKIPQTPMRNSGKRNHLLVATGGARKVQKREEQESLFLSTDLNSSLDSTRVNLKLYYLFFKTNYQFSKMLNFRLFQNLF